MPATTWALVINLSGPMTKPEPSICREHDGAAPRTLSTDSPDFRSAADVPSVGSGALTCTSGVGVSGSRMAGNPESSNSWRIRVETSRTLSGITSSTAPSTEEDRTADAIHG